MTIDVKQGQAIKMLAIGLAGLGGLVAFMTYLEGKKHRKIAEANAALENEIKVLQLEQLKMTNNKLKTAA